MALFSLCPSSSFPVSEVFYACSKTVLRDCDRAVGTDGQVGNFVMILAVWCWRRGSLCLPLLVPRLL